MEISKIEFKIPIYIKEKAISPQSFYEEICSNDCIFKNRDRLQYAIPTTLAGNYLYVTNSNSIIKKRRFLENTIWDEFGSKYEIDILKQDMIFEKLMDQPLDELPRIINTCRCSQEIEYLDGDLLFNYSNPTIRLYKENYSCIKIENEQSMWEVLQKAQQALYNIHNFGFVHGDPCSHNILITDDKVKYIDLDTIMPIDDINRERDFFIFIFFTIIPFAKSVQDDESFRKLIINIFDIVYKTGRFSDVKVIRLCEKSSKTIEASNYIDNYIPWFINFIYDNLQKTNGYLVELKKLLSETRISLLDSNRIFTNKITEIEEDRGERLNIINKLQVENEEIEKDREARLETINRQQKIIKEIEKDREARLETINRQQKIIEEIEKDREARLETINKQQKIIEEIEKDREARLETINKQQKIVEEMDKMK